MEQRALAADSRGDGGGGAAVQLLSGLALGEAGEPPERDAELVELDGARGVAVDPAELARDVLLCGGHAEEAAGRGELAQGEPAEAERVEDSPRLAQRLVECGRLCGRCEHGAEHGDHLAGGEA